MDLQKHLLESKKQKHDGRRWLTSAFSLSLHGALIAGIVYAGAHKATAKIDAERPINAFTSRER